jgi:hypothetical protein
VGKRVFFLFCARQAQKNSVGKNTILVDGDRKHNKLAPIAFLVSQLPAYLRHSSPWKENKNFTLGKLYTLLRDGNFRGKRYRRNQSYIHKHKMPYRE